MYDMKHAKNRRWARRKMIRMGLMKSDFVTGPFKGRIGATKLRSPRRRKHL